MNDEIKQALFLIASGMSKAEVARRSNVSPRTVGRWIDKYGLNDAAKTIESDVNEALDEFEKEDSEPESLISVLATRKSISLTKIDRESGSVIDSVVITNESENFNEVFNMISDSGLSQDVLNEAYALCTPKTLVEVLSSGKIRVDVRKNSITYTPDDGDEFEVSHKLSSRIIETMRKDSYKGAESIMAFLNRLMKNPSYRAVNELYGFLSHNDIEINKSGKFYAWKVVRGNYLDKHSGTMLNAVGLDVRVNRNQVDEDSKVTCSYGLHVCAKHYIKWFYSSGDRIVKVEVDPEDVVAIPADYKDSKMRCCGYKVVEDVTDSFYG